MRIRLDFDINSGAAAILYAVGFFLVCVISKWLPAVALNIVGIEGAWTLGLGGYLLKRHGNNSIQLESQKLGVCNQEPK